MTFLARSLSFFYAIEKLLHHFLMHVELFFALCIGFTLGYEQKQGEETHEKPDKALLQHDQSRS